MPTIDELFQSARQIWVWPNQSPSWRDGLRQKVSICQADLGLAELCSSPPSSWLTKFQSARQIWVWPNQVRKEANLAELRVSICQADLGLAELSASLAAVSSSIAFQSARQIWVWPNLSQAELQWIEAKFQSARQIWVWPNNTIPSIVRCNRECFNLPGRFGFGRTADPVAVDPTARSFQSARQIWVWPNISGAPTKHIPRPVFQSARQIWVWPNRM